MMLSRCSCRCTQQSGCQILSPREHIAPTGVALSLSRFSRDARPPFVISLSLSICRNFKPQRSQKEHPPTAREKKSRKERGRKEGNRDSGRHRETENLSLFPLLLPSRALTASLLMAAAAAPKCASRTERKKHEATTRPVGEKQPRILSKCLLQQ